MNHHDTIARILARGITSDTAGPVGRPVKCVRCRDSGVQEFTGGQHVTGRGVKVEATPEKPVYKRCSCLDQKADPPEPSRRYSAA